MSRSNLLMGVTLLLLAACGDSATASRAQKAVDSSTILERLGAFAEP